LIGVLILTLLILLFLTVPIFAALALSALVVFAIYFPGQGMDLMLAQSMVKSCDSFPLMAIPFFMLVGTLMSKGGLAKKLVDIAEAFTGNSAGGLGTAAIVASMLFAAISGSGPATAAAIGGIMIPAMAKQGYGKEYSASLLAAGSTIGPVIPPSIPMIMFAVTIGCSTTTLFMAGVIPGLLMGVGLIVYNKWISKRKDYRGESLSEEKGSKAKTIKEGIWALLMPVIVLGGIYSGIFTPTESAVVGVVYSLAVSKFIYKTLTWQGLKESLVDAAITSATIMILFGGANTFGRILTLGDIPATIAGGILSVTSSKIVIMILINLILLVVGMFIDTNSSVILFAPIVVPLLTQLGYHEIFIGVMMVVNLCIGMLTPPLGPNLFITMRIGGVSLEKTLPSALATIVILYIVLAVMIIFPELVLCLPRLLGMI
jgi:C4-dicarboxylate transporter DctM subunit